MRLTEQYLRQYLHGVELMTAYENYARSLGCRVIQDEIHVETKEQAAALEAWWKKRSGSGRSGDAEVPTTGGAE